MKQYKANNVPNECLNNSFYSNKIEIFSVDTLLKKSIIVESIFKLQHKLMG